MSQSIAYSGVPTVKEFQKDSSVTLAVRSKDRVLSYLDWLLVRYELHTADGNYSLRRVALCELFVSSNYWIKSFHQHRPNMLKERYPAVSALFEAVVAQLATLLECSRPEVGAYLTEIFGRDLRPEAVDTDHNMNALFYSHKERALFQIRFKHGLAYHYGLNANPHSLRYSLLNTAPFYTDVTRKAEDGKQYPTNEGWAAFVMTLEREFFMAQHVLAEKRTDKSVFHSAYTYGGPVSTAGTMNVVNGVISGIRIDSGHYRPDDQNIAASLLALQMFAVRMDRIQVFNHKNESLGMARDFMARHLSWDKYQDARGDFKKKRADAAAAVEYKRSALV